MEKLKRFKYTFKRAYYEEDLTQEQIRDFNKTNAAYNAFCFKKAKDTPDYKENKDDQVEFFSGILNLSDMFIVANKNNHLMSKLAEQQ